MFDSLLTTSKGVYHEVGRLLNVLRYLGQLCILTHVRTALDPLSNLRRHTLLGSLLRLLHLLLLERLLLGLMLLLRLRCLLDLLVGLLSLWTILLHLLTSLIDKLMRVQLLHLWVLSLWCSLWLREP